MMNTFLQSLTPTQQQHLLPTELDFTRMGCDFDEPPARISARDRLQPMLRYLIKNDMDNALIAIQRLCAQHPEHNFYLTELAVQLAARGLYAEALPVLEKVLQRNPDHAQALKYAAFANFSLNNPGKALELFGESLKRQPGDVFANSNFAMIKGLVMSSRQNAPLPAMPPTAICTSLPPGNLEMTRKAVDSWLKRGFTVYSVNTAQEKALLQAHFPDVHFYVCEHTAKEKFGKDFQYLNTVMECLATAGTPVCGIVNADIILRGHQDNWNAIAHSGLSHFTYGSRVNVNNLNDQHGWIHEPGFDIFFFPAAFTRMVPQAEYALGLPWWDMFLPNWAMASGLPTAFVYAPVALHLNHPMNWDFDLYYDFGMYSIRRFLAPMLGNLVAENPGKNLYLRRLVAAVAFTVKRTPKGAAKAVVCPGADMRTAHVPFDPMHWVHLEYETLVMF